MGCLEADECGQEKAHCPPELNLVGLLGLGEPGEREPPSALMLTAPSLPQDGLVEQLYDLTLSWCCPLSCRCVPAASHLDASMGPDPSADQTVS